jgi:hypothetical protein
VIAKDAASRARCIGQRRHYGHQRQLLPKGGFVAPGAAQPLFRELQGPHDAQQAEGGGRLH